eukprot:TRINITY_DN4390_c0_g2_i1.p1 TRINITY_DN4390_c0_g2~~TRINITY_DN4390_c0_g2_i1.p1  ORF type:complete len:750 (+),score=93.68 TRINITY_DN4390_c0_g2_i1:64-2313(+)
MMRSVPLILVSFVCCVLDVVAYVNCSALGFTIQGHGYYFHKDEVLTSSNQWELARNNCSNMHPSADLAVVYDPLNFDLLYNSYVNVPSGLQCYFIGLRQPDSGAFDQDFNWTWIDGTSFGNTIYGYVEWANGQPYPSSDNCGALWKGEGVANIGCGKDCSKMCAIPSFLCSDSAALNCPAGSGGLPPLCQPCSSGRYSVGNESVCHDCVPGRYSKSFGSSFCLDCPLHFYSNQPGSTQCSECPRGTRTFNNGSSKLSDCIIQTCSSWNNEYIAQGVRVLYDTTAKSHLRMFHANVKCSELMHGAGIFLIDKTSTLQNVQSKAPNSTVVHLGIYNLGIRNFFAMDANIPVDFNALFPSYLFTGSASTGNCTYYNTSSGTVNISSDCLQDRNYWCQIRETFCSQNEQCFPGQYLDSYAYRPQCQNCSQGTYSQSNNSLSCTLCDLGSYSNTTASTSCSLCSAGRFSNLKSSSSCLFCDPGMYQPLNGLSFCLTCPPGSISDVIGSVSCIPCPAGTFVDNSGKSSCILCPEGRYQPRNSSTSCMFCSQGMFSNVSGLSVCAVCIYKNSITPGLGSTRDSQCVCMEGFYGSPPAVSCIACERSPALTCPQNSSIPFIFHGYYRAGVIGNDVNYALLCQPMEACEQTGRNLVTTCNSAYTGFLCGLCASGHYRSGSSCRSCPGATVKWITVLIGLIVLLVLMARLASHQTQIPTDVRILLQSIQFVALYPNITSKWPESVRIVFQIFSLSVSFN